MGGLFMGALGCPCQGMGAMNNEEQQFLNELDARLWNAADRQNVAGLGYEL